MPCDLHWLVFESDHRLREHDCSLLTPESIKRFVTVWLLLHALRVQGLQLRLRQFAHFVFLSFKSNDNWIERLYEVLNSIIDSRISE